MLSKVLLILGAVITFTACVSNYIDASTSDEYAWTPNIEEKIEKIVPHSATAHMQENKETMPDNHWLIRPKKDYKGEETNDTSLPRILFRDDVEAGINKQINLELFAHYTYLSMAYHFDRDDINMPGFHKFFLKMAKEEHEHAQMFMKYQNKRGGRIRLRSIGVPCCIWGSGTEAMSKALELEKNVSLALLDLHKNANLGQPPQPQFLDFLESNFLGEQVDSIKQISNYVNILKRLNNSLGEYQFDKLTLLNKE